MVLDRLTVAIRGRIRRCARMSSALRAEGVRTEMIELPLALPVSRPLLGVFALRKLVPNR